MSNIIFPPEAVMLSPFRKGTLVCQQNDERDDIDFPIKSCMSVLNQKITQVKFPQVIFLREVNDKSGGCYLRLVHKGLF